jgi:aryl-alcohol dehydrogenase-like predicted oxidoreductase
MNCRYLGRGALQVSPLCLGAMMFGGETDEATSRRIIDKAFRCLASISSGSTSASYMIAPQ